MHPRRAPARGFPMLNPRISQTPPAVHGSSEPCRPLRMAAGPKKLLARRVRGKPCSLKTDSLRRETKTSRNTFSSSLSSSPLRELTPPLTGQEAMDVQGSSPPRRHQMRGRTAPRPQHKERGLFERLRCIRHYSTLCGRQALMLPLYRWDK